MTTEEADLKLAFDALKAKQSTLSTLWNYYDGRHPLVYAASRLKDLFRNVDAHFAENWCGLVVDLTLDRINLKRFSIAGSDELTKQLNGIFSQTEMNLDADDIHKAALVAGESYIIAWPDEDGQPEAHYNDPRLCHLQYDPANRKRKLWAAKWWRALDGRWHINIFYPDRIMYYIGRSEKPIEEGVPDEITSFVPAELPEAPNPFSAVEVPVFHFRRVRRRISSELTRIISNQAAINKLFADMMVTAEFGSFPQRYTIGEMSEKGTLKNIPNEIWGLPEGVQVGQFESADLGNYIKAMDAVAGKIATLSRTPAHYFFHSATPPSGEALIAMEAPLNKKAATYISRFSNTWQRFGAFMLMLGGNTVEPEAVMPVFDRPQTVQPKTQAEIREINKRAGVPLETTLKEEGKSQEQIEEIMQAKADEAAAGVASLADAMLRQQRKFDQQEED